jgi:histone H3/H4
MLIVVSKVKAATDKRVSAEALHGFSEFVEKLVEGAAKAAEDDGMATIKVKHIGTAFVTLAAEEIPKGE